jgi:hypothetical protein
VGGILKQAYAELFDIEYDLDVYLIVRSIVRFQAKSIPNYHGLRGQ